MPSSLPRWIRVPVGELLDDPVTMRPPIPVAPSLTADAVKELLIQRPIIAVPDTAHGKSVYRPVAGIPSLSVAKACLSADEQIPVLSAPDSDSDLRHAVDDLLVPTVEHSGSAELPKRWQTAHTDGVLPIVLGRQPTQPEIARFLGVSLSTYKSHCRDRYRHGGK